MNPQQRSGFSSPMCFRWIAVLSFVILCLGLPLGAGAQGQVAADIQLGAGDKVASEMTSIDAGPGEQVTVEVFVPAFTGAQGAELLFMIDAISQIDTTVTQGSSFFSISQLPRIREGNTISVSPGAFLPASGTAESNHVGGATFKLSASFAAVNITLKRVTLGGIDVVYEPNITLTVTNPLAGPKTFTADLDPLPGNQGVLSRRANPGTRFPVQTFAGKLQNVTAIEIHAEIDPTALDLERTGFIAAPGLALVGPSSGGGTPGTGGVPDGSTSDVGIDIEAGTGDKALSGTRSAEVEPGQKVTVEVFVPAFTGAQGAELLFEFDDISAIDTTVTQGSSFFSISQLPRIREGNTI